MNIPFGIHNGGNTCYFNALYQLLVSSPHIIQSIIHNNITDDEHVELHKKKEFDENKGVIESKYITKEIIIALMSKSEKTNLSVSYPRLKHIGFIMEKLFRSSINPNTTTLKKKEDDYGILGYPDCPVNGLYIMIDKWNLSKLVDQTIQVIMKCEQCGHTESKLETRISITVYDYNINTPIPQHFQDTVDRPQDYMCEKCKCKNSVTLYKHINSLGPVIFITFNLLSHLPSYSSYFTTQKINYVNNVPTVLVVNNALYHLAGAVLFNASHYWFVGKRKSKIFIINDAHVTQCKTEFELQSQLKYSRILMYTLV